MWFTGEVPAFVAVLMLTAQWFRSDTAAAAAQGDQLAPRRLGGPGRGEQNRGERREAHVEEVPVGDVVRGLGGEQREDIGADRVKGDIAEVEQAGEPDHDVEPEGERHEDPDLGGDLRASEPLCSAMRGGAAALGTGGSDGVSWCHRREAGAPRPPTVRPTPPGSGPDFSIDKGVHPLLPDGPDRIICLEYEQPAPPGRGSTEPKISLVFTPRRGLDSLEVIAESAGTGLPRGELYPLRRLQGGWIPSLRTQAWS